MCLNAFVCVNIDSLHHDRRYVQACGEHMCIIIFLDQTLHFAAYTHHRATNRQNVAAGRLVSGGHRQCCLEGDQRRWVRCVAFKTCIVQVWVLEKRAIQLADPICSRSLAWASDCSMLISFTTYCLLAVSACDSCK